MSHRPIKEESFLFEIEKPFISDSSDFTHAIYLSWSRDRRFVSQSNSLIAAKYAADWAKRNGVQIVFISSMSASVSSPVSNYGRFKREAEDYYLCQGYSVVRPGTVYSKDNLGGSALLELGKLPMAIKRGLGFFEPVWLPVISDVHFCQYFSTNFPDFHSQHAVNLYETHMSIQSLLNQNHGFISVKVLKLIAPLLPINFRDRLQTIIDLN